MTPKFFPKDKILGTYKGRHDSSVRRELRANWLREGKGGAACRRVSRWPMGRILKERGPGCTLHSHDSPNTTLHYPLPSYGGRQCAAPTIPPTRHIWIRKADIYNKVM